MQSKENRLHVRFPFSALSTYTVLGDEFHLPSEVSTEAQMVDLSDHGARISFRRWMVTPGVALVLRIPVSETGTTAPTLVQVKWVKEYRPGVWHAGLSFML
jgi:hypothetical protein